MKILIFLSSVLLAFSSCNHKDSNMKKVIFLHHSTGKNIWKGSSNKYLFKLTGKGDVSKWIRKLNKTNAIKVDIKEQVFPKKAPYGWNNYPFDYYNIWVKNAGNMPFMDEPTLEILVKEYDLIVWKHCYPVSGIKENGDTSDINSSEKTLDNYKLQYNALKQKMHSFPDTKFLIWTPTALVEKNSSPEKALRAKEFYEWIINEWDTKNDNIYLWDFHALETEGNLYLKPEYAVNIGNSHPNKEFSAKVAKYFANRIFQVFNGTADQTDITGKDN